MAKEKIKKEKKEKRGWFKNSHVLDYLVFVCIFSIQIFVVVALYFYYKYEAAPPYELMTYFFTFFGTELLAMAAITITGKVTQKKPSEFLTDLIAKREEKEKEEENVGL